MASKSSESERHRRTRNDHATETAEDYVEAIAEIEESEGDCRLVDLASRFAVSHVTVNRIVARLEREGLVKTVPYKPVSLTVKGRQLATRCRKRHQIVLQFLLSIGVDQETAEIDAEGIEHHVSSATLRKFQSLTEERSAEARDDEC